MSATNPRHHRWDTEPGTHFVVAVRFFLGRCTCSVQAFERRLHLDCTERTQLPKEVRKRHFRESYLSQLEPGVVSVRIHLACSGISKLWAASHCTTSAHNVPYLGRGTHAARAAPLAQLLSGRRCHGDRPSTSWHIGELRGVNASCQEVVEPGRHVETDFEALAGCQQEIIEEAGC